MQRNSITRAKSVFLILLISQSFDLFSIFWRFPLFQGEVSKLITLNVKSDDKPETNEEYQIQLINITTYGKARVRHSFCDQHPFSVFKSSLYAFDYGSYIWRNLTPIVDDLATSPHVCALFVFLRNSLQTYRPSVYFNLCFQSLGVLQISLSVFLEEEIIWFLHVFLINTCTGTCKNSQMMVLMKQSMPVLKVRILIHAYTLVFTIKRLI